MRNVSCRRPAAPLERTSSNLPVSVRVRREHGHHLRYCFLHPHGGPPSSTTWSVVGIVPTEGAAARTGDRRDRFAPFALVAVAALTVSSCAYLQAATNAETVRRRRCRGGAPPPRRSPSPTGPAVGHRRLVRRHPQGAAAPGTSASHVSAQFDVATDLRPAVADRGCRRGRRLARGHRRTSPAWAPTTSAAASRPPMLADPSFNRAEPDPRRRRARRRVRPDQARGAAVRRQRPRRQARRLRLLRPHRPPGCRRPGSPATTTGGTTTR